MLLDYSYYRYTYGGSIPAAEWYRLKTRAVEELARYKRSYTVTVPDPESEAKAICAMTDTFAYFEMMRSEGTVASASIGSVSVNYSGAGSGADFSPKAEAKELYRCASQYLDIYRGVG